MLVMRARLEKAFAGLKTRFSTRWDSMFWLIGRLQVYRERQTLAIAEAALNAETGPLQPRTGRKGQQNVTIPPQDRRTWLRSCSVISQPKKRTHGLEEESPPACRSLP